jgi:hypothetical protein
VGAGPTPPRHEPEAAERCDRARPVEVRSLRTQTVQPNHEEVIAAGAIRKGVGRRHDDEKGIGALQGSSRATESS